MTRKGVGKRLLCLAGAPRATPPLIPGATKEPKPLAKHMTYDNYQINFPPTSPCTFSSTKPHGGCREAHEEAPAPLPSHRASLAPSTAVLAHSKQWEHQMQWSTSISQLSAAACS